MPRTPERQRTYMTWYRMVQRCTNPQEPQFADYGGRGIKVCGRWMDVDNFIADLGHRPEDMTLEREDNEKDYEPNNCRWATRAEQQRNRRNTIRVRLPDNSVKCLKDVCEIYGVQYLA